MCRIEAMNSSGWANCSRVGRKVGASCRRNGSPNSRPPSAAAAEAMAARVGAAASGPSGLGAAGRAWGRPLGCRGVLAGRSPGAARSRHAADGGGGLAGGQPGGGGRGGHDNKAARARGPAGGNPGAGASPERGGSFRRARGWGRPPRWGARELRNMARDMLRSDVARAHTCFSSSRSGATRAACAHRPRRRAAGQRRNPTPGDAIGMD
jgi:hypothetical protein